MPRSPPLCAEEPQDPGRPPPRPPPPIEEPRLQSKSLPIEEPRLPSSPFAFARVDHLVLVLAEDYWIIGLLRIIGWSAMISSVEYLCDEARMRGHRIDPLAVAIQISSLQFQQQYVVSSVK
jgi:hypothetical protein